MNRSLIYTKQPAYLQAFEDQSLKGTIQLSIYAEVVLCQYKTRPIHCKP